MNSRRRRRYEVGLLLTFLGLLGATGLYASVTLPQQASVILDVIQCRQGRAEVPTVQVAQASAYPDLVYAGIGTKVATVSDGFNRISFHVSAGNYFVRVQSPSCANYLQSGFLPGHRRTLSIALDRRCPLCNVKTFSLESAVAGELAVQPSVGLLVASDGSKRVLDLQDGAYYIEKVPPGLYSIRLELQGGLQSEITLDLSGLSTRGFARRDVDSVTFRRQLGSILKDGSTLRECRWCY